MQNLGSPAAPAVQRNDSSSLGGMRQPAGQQQRPNRGRSNDRQDRTAGNRSRDTSRDSQIEFGKCWDWLEFGVCHAKDQCKFAHSHTNEHAKRGRFTKDGRRAKPHAEGPRPAPARLQPAAPAAVDDVIENDAHTAAPAEMIVYEDDKLDHEYASNDSF